MSKNYYEPPVRPPYEYRAAICWMGAGFIVTSLPLFVGAPLIAALAVGGIAFALACWRYYQGLRFAEARKRLLLPQDIWLLTVQQVQDCYARARKRDAVWLGEGFELNQDSAEKIALVANRGLAEYLDVDPSKVPTGVGWVQAIEPSEPIEVDLKTLEGHTLIVGSTRTGKTRLFDHIIGQAIRRGEPVIVLDPKGDHDLEKLMRQAYASVGAEDKFAAFRPAWPEDSVRLDPLSNWTRTTEVASRVAALVEADGAFLAFVWGVLNNLVQGELAVGRKPNLLTLRRLVEHGSDGLSLEVLKTWCQHNAKAEEYAGYVNNEKTRSRGGELDGYITFYRKVLAGRAQSLAVESLINMTEHDKEHFSKMIVSLTPVLTMLTTPPLDELLSPVPRAGDHREIITLDKIVKQARGLYVSLSSMADPVVGAAIGSILEADLAAFAGARYDAHDTKPVVNLLVDEVAEVTNAQLTQLMNKGGGAGVRVTIATQTLSDLTARLGNEARALQQIGNANNIIALRVQDPKTAELLSKGMPMFKARTVNRTSSQSLQAEPHSVWNGSLGESIQQESVPLVTPDLLMRLPTTHYIGRFADGRIVKGKFPVVVQGESE